MFSLTMQKHTFFFPENLQPRTMCHIDVTQTGCRHGIQHENTIRVQGCDFEGDLPGPRYCPQPPLIIETWKFQPCAQCTQHQYFNDFHFPAPQNNDVPQTPSQEGSQDLQAESSEEDSSVSPRSDDFGIQETLLNNLLQAASQEESHEAEAGGSDEADEESNNTSEDSSVPDHATVDLEDIQEMDILDEEFQAFPTLGGNITDSDSDTEDGEESEGDEELLAELLGEIRQEITWQNEEENEEGGRDEDLTAEFLDEIRQVIAWQGEEEIEEEEDEEEDEEEGAETYSPVRGFNTPYMLTYEQSEKRHFESRIDGETPLPTGPALALGDNSTSVHNSDDDRSESLPSYEVATAFEIDILGYQHYTYADRNYSFGAASRVASEHCQHFCEIFRQPMQDAVRAQLRSFPTIGASFTRLHELRRSYYKAQNELRFRCFLAQEQEDTLRYKKRVDELDGQENLENQLKAMHRLSWAAGVPELVEMQQDRAARLVEVIAEMDDEIDGEIADWLIQHGVTGFDDPAMMDE